MGMLNLKDHPSALKNLFFTEMWERFSFYGLNAIALLYLTKAIGMPVNNALIITGSYITYVYFATTVGGYIADRFLGSYRVVFIGGIFILLGHISLTVSAFAFPLFYLGLGLIATGTGLLKPNISVMVGKLYTTDEEDKRTEGFNIYYLGINIGAFIAPFAVGFTAQKINWHLGFLLAAIGMAVGLIVFRLGYKRYGERSTRYDVQKVNQFKFGLKIYWWIILFLIAITIVFAVVLSHPVQSGLVMTICLLAMVIYIIKVWHQLTKIERKGVRLILILSLFSVCYWSLSDQVISSIPLLIDRVVNTNVFGFSIPASSVSGAYSLLLIIIAPFLNLLWIFLCKIKYNITYAEIFTYGLFSAAIAFVVIILAITLTPSGMKMSLAWIILSYAFLALGELFISPNGLALVTSYSPPNRVGVMMGLWWMINAFAGYISALISQSIGFDKAQNLPIFSQMKIYATGYWHVCISIIIISIFLFFFRHKFKVRYSQEDYRK